MAPALTQVEAGQWDIPLFSFLVPPNSGTTLTGFIDERTWVDPGVGFGKGADPECNLSLLRHAGTFQFLNASFDACHRVASAALE